MSNQEILRKHMKTEIRTNCRKHNLELTKSFETKSNPAPSDLSYMKRVVTRLMEREYTCKDFELSVLVVPD